MPLPNDRDARNAIPIWDGVMVYFPDAWAEIAKVSVIGNKQHNLGAAKLYFNRTVSTDHANKVMRHMLDHAAGHVYDTDGTYHLAKAAWRALAALQVAIEERATLQRATTNAETFQTQIGEFKCNLIAANEREADMSCVQCGDRNDLHAGWEGALYVEGGGHNQ